MADKKPKRKTWHDRRCSCGDPVEFRVQLDIAHCRKRECWDRAMANLGYVPGPELLKERGGSDGR